MNIMTFQETFLGTVSSSSLLGSQKFLVLDYYDIRDYFSILVFWLINNPTRHKRLKCCGVVCTKLASDGVCLEGKRTRPTLI